MKLFSLQQKFWKYIKIPKFSISVLLAIPVLSPKENLPVWTPTGSALFLSVPLLHPCLICCLACGNFGFFLALAQNSCFLSKSNESRLSEIPFRCDVANGHEIHRNLTMTLPFLLQGNIISIVKDNIINKVLESFAKLPYFSKLRIAHPSQYRNSKSSIPLETQLTRWRHVICYTLSQLPCCF